MQEQGELFEQEVVDPGAQDEEFFEETDSEDVETDELPDDVSIDGVDPDELPPELQDQYKQMLRGMNSKYQSWSDEKKQLQQSHDMLNKIISDPQARKVFLASVGAMGGEEGGEQAQAAQVGMSFNTRPDVKYDDVLEEAAIPAIEALVGSYMDKVLGPQAQALTQAVQHLLNDKQGQEWTNIETQYPNAKDYRAQAEQLSRKTGLSLKQALFAVSEGKLQAEAAPSTNGAKPKPRKPVSLTKQSEVSASRVTPKKGVANPNFADEVRNEMKRLGIKPLGW